jgi:hypothetical protein
MKISLFIVLVLVLTSILCSDQDSQGDSNRQGLHKNNILKIAHPKKINANSITGTYTILSSTLSNTITDSVTVSLTPDRISFKGCNTNSNSYTIGPNGDLSLTGKLWITTMMFCMVDNDAQIVNLLNTAVRVASKGTNVIFYDAND